MPSNAGHSRHCSELMNYISWKEIDVVIVKWYLGVANPFAMQLIQFRVFHPLYTLRDRRFIGIKLKQRDQIVEITSVEGHNILQAAYRLVFHITFIYHETQFTLVIRLILLLSPQRTALSIPTAAVVIRSRP